MYVIHKRQQFATNSSSTHSLYVTTETFTIKDEGGDTCINLDFLPLFKGFLRYMVGKHKEVFAAQLEAIPYDREDGLLVKAVASAVDDLKDILEYVAKGEDFEEMARESMDYWPELTVSKETTDLELYESLKAPVFVRAEGGECYYDG